MGRKLGCILGLILLMIRARNNIDQYPIVPEFPSPIILSLVMLATLVTLAYRKRETLHPRDRQ